LVTEELDSMAVFSDPNPDRVALFQGYREALSTIDMECGRALLGELREAGLIDTTADVRTDVIEGGTALAEWEQLRSSPCPTKRSTRGLSPASRSRLSWRASTIPTTGASASHGSAPAGDGVRWRCENR
jgi:hypothetical protein